MWYMIPKLKMGPQALTDELWHFLMKWLVHLPHISARGHCHHGTRGDLTSLLRVLTWTACNCLRMFLCQAVNCNSWGKTIKLLSHSYLANYFSQLKIWFSQNKKIFSVPKCLALQKKNLHRINCTVPQQTVSILLLYQFEGRCRNSRNFSVATRMPML